MVKLQFSSANPSHHHLKAPSNAPSNFKMSLYGLHTGVKTDAVVFPAHVRRYFKNNVTDYTGALVRLLDDISNATHSILALVLENASCARRDTELVGTVDRKRSAATRCLYKALTHDGYACLIVEKSAEWPLTLPADEPIGEYIVMLSALDINPLDSEHAVCGTLFSVYKRRSLPSLPGSLQDIQQNLKDQVAAGYVVYSSATTLYYTLGRDHGVYSFCLHPVANQYFLQPSTQRFIPETCGYVYGDRARILADASIANPVKQYLAVSENCLRKMFDEGTLTANFHAVATNGGLVVHFDCHLLCEAAPLALIVEQLGGSAVTSEGTRILDLALLDHHVHTTVTFIAGTKLAVNFFLERISQNPTDHEGKLQNGAI